MFVPYAGLAQEKKIDKEHVCAYETLLHKRRGFVMKPFAPNESVVLLLSGGLDSVGLWYFLSKKLQVRVFPLFIQTKLIDTKRLSILHHYERVFKKEFPALFQKVFIYKTQSSLFSYSKQKRSGATPMLLDTVLHNLVFIKGKRERVPIMSDWPSRLSFFSSVALDYATKISYQQNTPVQKIIYGLTPEENRFPGSLLPSLRLLTLTFCEITRNNNWQVVAPVDKKNKFFIRKHDLISFAHSHSVSLLSTWSCSKSSLLHCGTCFNCIARMYSFKKAGVKDTTVYGPRPLISKKITNLAEKLVIKLVHNQKPSQPTQKNSVSEGALLHINPHIRWIKEINKIYIYNAEGVFLDVLTDTSFEVWLLIDSGAYSIHKIVNKLKYKYKVRISVLKKDVFSFIQEAYNNNYILTE